MSSPLAAAVDAADAAVKQAVQQWTESAASLQAHTGDDPGTVSPVLANARALSVTAAETLLTPTPEALAGLARSWSQAQQAWMAAADGADSLAQGTAQVWSGTDATAAGTQVHWFGQQANLVGASLGDVVAGLHRAEQAAEAAELTRRGGAGVIVNTSLYGQPLQVLGELQSGIGMLREAADAADRIDQDCATAIVRATDGLGAPFKATLSSVISATVASAVGAARAGASKAAAPVKPTIKPKNTTKTTAPVRTTAPSKLKPSVRTTAPANVSKSAYRKVAPNAAVGKRVGTLPAGTSARRQQIVKAAQRYTGVRYLWGGTTPKGFDCSGFVQYVYRQAGINLPRTSAAQKQFGTPIPKSQAKPGDLVSLPHHIGIYLGNGMMIDAPRPGKSIQVRKIWTPNYQVVRVLK